MSLSVNRMFANIGGDDGITRNIKGDPQIALHHDGINRAAKDGG